MNRLSVIIPSRNAGNLTPCITAIWDLDPELRVIVIDDGLEWPAFMDLLGSRPPRQIETLTIRGEKPFSFPRNINLGIIAAGSDDVILCNDDAILKTPGGFSLLQNAAEQHPVFGIIGATTDVTGQPEQQPRGIGLREVPHFAFVCVLIPRRTIDLLGGLDERYCLDYGCDDRDYCEAVTRAGLKVGVHDGCFVDHGSLTSTYRGDPYTPKSFARNYALLLEKWGSLSC